MKHLILKKEIQLGTISVVPETTKMPLSMSELVNYMSFPKNKFAINALQQLFVNDDFISSHFTDKYSIDTLLKEAGYSFNQDLANEPQRYLEEVAIAWADFLRKMKTSLMNVRYNFLITKVDINPSKLYQ